MRELAGVLSALLALGAFGSSGPVLASSASAASGPEEGVFDVVEQRVHDVAVLACGSATDKSAPVYRRCDVQFEEAGDPRTGASYTSTASAEVCRREQGRDECVGTTQTVGRAGAEAGPSVNRSESEIPLPQACVGSTCTPEGTAPVQTRTTVFDSGTAPEVTAYAPTGSVNANAPQVCVSVDSSCAGSSTPEAQPASVETFSATDLITTD